MTQRVNETVYWLVMGWTKGMALPEYIDGPFLNENDARQAAIDWLASERADAYSVMATEPQKPLPDFEPFVEAASAYNLKEAHKE